MMRPVPSTGRCASAAWLHTKAAHEVDVDDAAEVLLREVRKHGGRDGAGIVDQYVQCAAAQFGRRCGGFGRRRRVAHIEDERLRGTAGGGDGFRGCHRGVLVDIGHQHSGPGRGEGAGDRLADAAARTGHQRRAAVEPEDVTVWVISSSSADPGHARPGS